jgi:hypothetical protein
MPASTHEASAMCQDSNLFLPEADLKDPVVPVCHHHTPAIGYLAKSHHLVILSDSIKPWPMTGTRVVGEQWQWRQRGQLQQQQVWRVINGNCNEGGNGDGNKGGG